jgi:aspartyl-tRNA(Asn)/glutamyl-tRNA(Gln) amidotransferase subunit A
MSRTEMILSPSSVPNADPIYYKDATELAALIRTKQLSSREVVQAHLDRIKTINPKVNAIVTLLAEDALKGADLADKAVKNGEALGLLHGVPFTIKDAIDTAGVLTQRASKIFAGNIPEKDATVVTRFKAAGAIPNHILLESQCRPQLFRWFDKEAKDEAKVKFGAHKCNNRESRERDA